MPLTEAQRLVAIAPGTLTIKCTDWVGDWAVLGASRYIAGYVPDLSLAIIPQGRTDLAMELYNDWLLDHLCHPDPSRLGDVTRSWRRRHGLPD